MSSSLHPVVIPSHDKDKNKMTESEHIIDSINSRSAKPWISVEFFPPKTEAGNLESIVFAVCLLRVVNFEEN
jgi:hypothetical protein